MNLELNLRNSATALLGGAVIVTAAALGGCKLAPTLAGERSIPGASEPAHEIPRETESDFKSTTPTTPAPKTGLTSTTSTSSVPEAPKVAITPLDFTIKPLDGVTNAALIQISPTAGIETQVASPTAIILMTQGGLMTWRNGYRVFRATDTQLCQELGNTNATSDLRYTHTLGLVSDLQKGVNERDAAVVGTVNGISDAVNALAQAHALTKGKVDAVEKSAISSVELDNRIDEYHNKQRLPTNTAEFVNYVNRCNQQTEYGLTGVTVGALVTGLETEKAKNAALGERLAKLEKAVDAKILPATAPVAAASALALVPTLPIPAPTPAPLAPAVPILTERLPRLVGSDEQITDLLKDAREAYWLGRLPESFYNQLKREVNKGASLEEIRHTYLNRRD